MAITITCPFCKTRFEENKIDDTDTNKCTQCGAEETRPEWEVNTEVYAYKRFKMTMFRRLAIETTTKKNKEWRTFAPKRLAIETTTKMTINSTMWSSFDRYQEFCMWISNKYPNTEKMMFVYSLGLIGELIEFFEAEPDKKEKEAGDVYWYIATCAGALQIKMSALNHYCDETNNVSKVDVDFQYMTFQKQRAMLLHHAKNIIEMTKKVYGHGHTLNRDKYAKELSIFLDLFTTHMFTQTAMTLVEILKSNVEKLFARYPNGFETQRSINKEQE